MKQILLIVTLTILLIDVNAQTSCNEFMTSVKSKGYGTTYSSYNSDAISKVTFYDITIDYKYYYFAIVCFKQEYSSCKEIFLDTSNFVLAKAE